MRSGKVRRAPDSTTIRELAKRLNSAIDALRPQRQLTAILSTRVATVSLMGRDWGLVTGGVPAQTPQADQHEHDRRPGRSHDDQKSAVGSH